MRLSWWCILAALSVARSQENASMLAWSHIGEATGVTDPLGGGQPAALAGITGSLAFISTIPRVHGIDVLHYGGAGYLTGTGRKGWEFAMSAIRAGASRRVQTWMAFGGLVREGVRAGLGVRIGRWSFPRYAAVHEIELCLGAQVRHEPISTGVAVTLQTQEYRKGTVDEIRLAVGGTVDLSEGVVAVAEAVDDGMLELRLGTRVVILDAFSLICSWSDAAETFGTGFDFRAYGWGVLTGARWHPTLGWTVGLDLRFAWR